MMRRLSLAAVVLCVLAFVGGWEASSDFERRVLPSGPVTVAPVHAVGPLGPMGPVAP